MGQEGHSSFGTWLNMASDRLWIKVPRQRFVRPFQIFRLFYGHITPSSVVLFYFCVSVFDTTLLIHVSIVYDTSLLTQFSIPSVLWRCWLGSRNGIRPVKNGVVGCCRGYLSGARCRLACGPADATATHCLLLQQSPAWFSLSGTGLPE